GLCLNCFAIAVPRHYLATALCQALRDGRTHASKTDQTDFHLKNLSASGTDGQSRYASRRLLQRRQRRFDLLAPRLEEARKLQRLAERVDGLVDRKARIIGRNLEQHSARLAEIDRPEILPIDLLGRPEAMVCGGLARHGRLRCIIGGAERDVM